MALNVLMVGGRRCGKTSVLAALFDQMTNGVVNQFFTVCDNTAYVQKKDEKQDVLSAKSLELQQLLENPSNKTFLVDEKPTNYAWTYSLKLQLPGTNKSMEMNFLDVPGEYWEASTHDGETISFVAKSDVYIVAIDTPYLMADGASMAVFKAMNCVSDIHTFLTHLDSAKAKMVIFVPVKCEKWIKEGRADEIVEGIKREYAATIRALIAYPKMSVCIMPVQTAGNILFSEMKEAHLINGGGRENRCCMINDMMVRMWDGKFHPKKESDIINRDLNAKISNTEIYRPYPWFCINKKANDRNNLYQPYNCEQLPLHILSFWLQKYYEEFDIWDKIKGLFGGITAGQLMEKLNAIKGAGLLKNDVEGIKYLKNAFLRSTDTK